MAIKVGDGPTQLVWHPDIPRALAKIKWSDAELLCHHTHFDGLILSHHYGVTPAKYRDTLSMGRALHAKFERNNLATIAERYGLQNKLEMPDFRGKRYRDLTDAEKKALGEYNVRDTDITAELYHKLLPKMPGDEMDLIDVTVRMFVEPVLRLDRPLAQRELGREIVERAAAIAKSGADLPTLSSNKKFPVVLQSLGITPPKKMSKPNKHGIRKETYALSKADEDFTDLLIHPDPRVVALVKGRLAAKSTIGETRAARLLRSGARRMRLPVYLNYCGAHTTRWSGGDKLNYQNMKKTGRLREAILAPPGSVLVSVDSSQIEARIVAWLADEKWLLQAFRDGADPYVMFAEDVYGRKIDKRVDKLERFVAKTCVLGLGFQMGATKLQTTVLSQSIIQGLDPVRLDLSVCYGLVNRYRAKNTKIVGLWEFVHNDVIMELALGPCFAGAHKEFKGIEYGREFVRLKDHVALHYPEARCDVLRGAPRTAWSRTVANVAERVENASYRTPGGRTKMYGGMVTENLAQYLARIAVAEQMLVIAARYRVVMMSHDAIVFVAPKAAGQKALDFALKVMQTPPTWAPDLPVTAEGSFGNTY